MNKLSVSLLLIICSCKAPDQNLFSDQDRAAVQQLRNQYTQAWLDSDSAAVMSCLTDDAVLIPHHGDAQIEGKDAIRAFWWPPQSPSTQVTTFTSEISEVSGFGDLAYVRGRFQLNFDYDTLSYSNQGNFLNVIVRTPGGWKLSRLIWNDPLPDIAPQ